MSESRHRDRAVKRSTKNGELTPDADLTDNPNLNSQEAAMEWIGFEDKQQPGDWRVEANDYKNEGVIHVAIFSGPNAKALAKEYAEMKNAQENHLLSVAS